VRPAVLAILVLLLAAPPARAGKAVDGVVNLNTASVEVLGLLPGVGPAKAAEIAAYRKKRPFRTVDELVRIKGIGRKMVRRLRAHLAVAGPSTAMGVAGKRPEPPPQPPPAPRPPPPRVACAPCAKPARPQRQRPIPETWLTRGVCLRAR
jgi:competence protein ComEA